MTKRGPGRPPTLTDPVRLDILIERLRKDHHETDGCLHGWDIGTDAWRPCMCNRRGSVWP